MKKEPTRLNISERSFVNDYKDVKVEVLSDAKVFIYQLDKKESELTEDPSKEEKTTETDANDDAINDILIKMPTLFAEEVDLEEYPVLAKDDIVYLPMRALVGEEGLGWDLYYDPYVGTYLSTQEEKNAKSYWEEAESKYNQGLVNYIKGCNKNYTTSRAQELVFMFKRAAEVYNIDEKILMAVAQRESTFNPKAKGGSGSLGMMRLCRLLEEHMDYPQPNCWMHKPVISGLCI